MLKLPYPNEDKTPISPRSSSIIRFMVLKHINATTIIKKIGKIPAIASTLLASSQILE